MKTAETTGSQEKTITRDKTNNTTKDSGRPWHCIMRKLSTTSPEPLAIHMISNHWEDSWTIRTENTPREFKLATKGTKNQVQTKSMGNITKHTKKDTEIETNNSTETMARKKKTMNTKTRNNEKTEDAVGPMEVTVTQAIGPNNTRKAIKTAAIEATRATEKAVTWAKNLISITNNNLSKEIINKIKEMTKPTNAKSRNNETKNPANVVNTREHNGTSNAKEMTATIDAKEIYDPRRVTKDNNKATSNANEDGRPLTPPPEGVSKTAEGGARTQPPDQNTIAKTHTTWRN